MIVEERKRDETKIGGITWCELKKLLSKPYFDKQTFKKGLNEEDLKLLK